ncbi:MAG: DUF4352 domain-containing protein [Caldisericia bacterium]|nr:DUF4352 domain-containing protein [Caldisericia bacterium]
MNDKKSMHPGWIILLLLVLPPVGLVLLGEQHHIKPFFKICIGLCYGLILFLFIQHYQLVPRTMVSETLRHDAEKVQYKMLRIEYPSSLPNGLKEYVQKEDTETWVQVFIEVTNIGKQEIYYISLIDSPVLITKSGSIDPDLSLSHEPFGEISPQETKTGYLVFRLNPDQAPVTFQIASYSANLQ